MAVSTTSYVGQALPRREDPRLLRGEGRFVDDLAPHGCLHLEVFRSPYGAGRLLSLDVDAARAMPGVVAVLTAADLGLQGTAAVNSLLPLTEPQPMVVLADRQIDCVGQPVAAIIAETRHQARDAADLVSLDVEVAPTADRPVMRHEWISAAKKVTETQFVTFDLQHALVAPFALEPRAAVAEPVGVGLHLHLSTQTPQRCRDDLARMLGLPRSAIRVTATDVGGAFGGKASLMPEDVLTAVAARRLGRPVKWLAARSDEFLGATQGRGARVSAQLGLDADGRAVSLSADLTFPLGSWMPYSALAPIRNAGRILPGPYAVPAVCVTGRADLTEGAAVNIYRGAGRPEAALIMERLMDKAARLLGADPLDMRRRNLGMAGPLPTGERICSGDFAALLDRLEAETDYRTLRTQQAARRRDGELCGLGLALYVEPCGQGWETASISLQPDGRIVAGSGSSAQGQGRETALSQIVGDVLGVTLENVTIRHSDTYFVPEGIGALASRSTAIGATAMWKAAVEFLSQARAMAGRPEGPVDWAALAALGHPLTVSLRHDAEAEAWASGAVLAEVTLDRETGAITVNQITWVDDAGRVLNPLLVQGQLLGGLAQGLGATLMEQMVYREGQLLTGSLMDYAVPRATDMPPVRLISQPTLSTANPLGFKGVGEAGCIGVPAALVNAVMDALPPDTPDLSLPLTPEKVWRAIHGLEP